MYVKTWEEFERAAKNLYIQDPKKVKKMSLEMMHS